MYISWKERVKNRFSKYPKVWSALQWLKTVMYIFNYLRYYGFGIRSKSGSIREINVEFCSACNLRCKFCALDHLKPKQHISPKVLEKVLMELYTNPLFKNVEVLNLYNGGETLLHPNRLELFELIAHHKQSALKQGKRFPKVLLLTNGMLLRESLAKSILELNVLDVIQFSLDGGTKEKFEELRVNAKWKKFYSNVGDLIQLKNELQPNLQIKSITIVEEPNDLSVDWMDEEFRGLIDRMDSFELRRLHDWGGEIELNDNKQKNKYKLGCNMAMHQLVVLPNGDVTVCCNDLNSKGVIGNVQEQSMGEIYSSKERRHYLDKLLFGKRDEIELCKGCQSF
jgi:radical SAM protein with 4Fe4S-binding SPASM domain